MHAAERRVAAAEATARAMRSRLQEAEAVYRASAAELSRRFQALASELHQARRQAAALQQQQAERGEGGQALHALAGKSLAAQEGLMGHLAELERLRGSAAADSGKAQEQSLELVALRAELEALQLQLRLRVPADGAEAVFRARQLQLDLAKAEAERAQLASRAANAEEQLEQLQRYMTQHISAYQKEILSLRRQVALAANEHKPTKA